MNQILQKRLFLASIVFLASALFLISYTPAAYAAGDYCWCIRPDGICENHRVNASGEDIVCGSSGATGCSAYCASRSSDGTSWRAAHCDESYIARERESAGSAASPVCPPSDTATTETPETPTEETAAPSRSRSPSSYGYRNPLGTTNVNTVINRIIRAAVGVVGALFLAMFVWGGALWMTSAGDPERVKKGKQALLNALIGMVVVALSYTILNVLFGVAGSLTS